MLRSHPVDAIVATPDAGQVVGKTAPETAPPLIEAQSTAGAIANGASR
jgi:hypothetical protein